MLLRKSLKHSTNHPINWPHLQLLLLQLLLLSIITRCTFANPVSNPEIASKSNKAVNNAGNQQQVSLKVSQQDQQLNSLSAYAAANSYDGLTEFNFKPSYKLPDMETNFTPMQNGAVVNGAGPLPSPTPVIMQYIPPQTLNDGSVQYLQLIPTRPLIVPISPYMSAQQQAGPYHQALTADNTIGEYGSRPQTILGPLHPNNVGVTAGPPLINVPSQHLPYGLHTYANAIQPYRTGFRINREVKDKNLPAGLTLNLNEYFPGSHSLPSQLYLRGRP